MGGLLKVLSGLVLSVLVLLAFHAKTTVVTYDAYYESDKKSFFTYMTDPKNFKTINPTIIDLTVNQQKTNSLTIFYTEHLVQIPLIRNYAYAHYIFYDEGPIWKIQSNHRTCFYTDFFCMPTNSTVTIRTATEKHIHYEEVIAYSCPRLLKTFCQKEVHMQRRLIMDNLKKTF